MPFASSFLCIWILSSFSLLMGAQKSTNITLNSTLTAGNVSESPWVSPSGDFAFGFQPVAGRFLLAIWYNKIPDKTVTWFANGDELAQHGSTLSLSEDGLVLSDSNGILIWSTTLTTGGGRVRSAKMFDTGNLVLANESNSQLWRSFDTPTDTILPTQILTTGNSLVARFSPTNFSLGRFKLEMQLDGNLVLYITNWPLDSAKVFPYFSTQTSGRLYQTVLDPSGYLHVTNINGTDVGEVFPTGMDFKNALYKRAVLEFDGLVRMYVYPNSSSVNQTENWTLQSSVPNDICKKSLYEGGGVCGVNSTCHLGSDQRPNCHCLTNFTLINEMDQLGGCKFAFPNESIPENPSKHRRILPLIESLFLGSSVFLNILLCTLLVCICRRKTIKSQEHKDIAK